MVLAFLSITDTLLSYFDIDASFIAYINALLVWLFLYLSSFVFQFCRWHRMFLYYILLQGCLNCYDYNYVIPLALRNMIILQLVIIIVFISVGLYLHQHDKHARREDCC